MKKRIATFVFLFSLSKLSFADVLLNLAVAGVLAAGLVLGAGLIVAGAGAAWGLGAGLSFEVAGLSLICANGLVSYCSDTPENPASISSTSSLRVALAPGGSIPPDPASAHTFRQWCGNHGTLAVNSAFDAATFASYCNQIDYLEATNPSFVGNKWCNDGTYNALGDCTASSPYAQEVAPGGGRDLAGKFVPQADNLLGIPGIWTQSVPDSNWSFTPSDPADPIAEITPDNQKLKVTKPGNSGTPVDVVCQNYSDGSMNCSRGADVPVVSPQGVPATVKVVSTQSYDPLAAVAGPPVVQYSPTDSNNEPFNPDTYSLPPASTGTGEPISVQGAALDPATVPPPAGTGTGSCTSGDCSTESTQLANKGLLQTISGLLQGIKDFFTGTATEPGVPTARTANEIKASSLDGTGAFTGLKGWSLPAHTSQCPTSSFAWNGNTYTFDAHCQLASDHFAAFRGVMTLVFSLSALFVVLKA